ncbi:guanylate cyclase-like protein 3 [Sarcoptes scabiei]|uniref:Guanylate cyclase-like protein 3 n=1 Tax=Sarcoptes scabiei TaxID=52283 RepID=A0A132A3H9_SARSC|nr:guanylate cyclase-like protein 3 [Sarcoptes scabiei]
MFADQWLENQIIFNIGPNWFDYDEGCGENSNRIYQVQSNLVFLLWMAPEQLRHLSKDLSVFGEKPDERKIDVYSFAMTCYEIITQRIPFDEILNLDEDIENVLDLIKYGTDRSLPRPFEWNDEHQRIWNEMNASDCTKLRPKLCNHLRMKSKYREIFKLIEFCWSENPDSRPSFDLIEKQFKELLYFDR